MTQYLTLCFFALTLLMMAPMAAQAQEDTITPTRIEAPTREALNRKLDEISENLTPDQSRHFKQIYANYTLISTVKSVHNDVQNAITACGTNNESMKSTLEKRFDVWDKAVSASMTEAQGSLNNMVLAQDYATKSEIDAIFKQIDDTRTHANGQIKKIPVTTPEACEYLLNKMDETQATMTDLLGRTMMSLPKTYAETPQKPESDPLK